jgi:subtilisin family serine protease
MRVSLGDITNKISLGLEGLGDGCPSDEQLQGIQDCSDPCQAPNPPCTSAVTAASINSAATNTATLAVCTAGNGVFNANGTCTFPQAGIPPSLLGVGAAVAFVFLLIVMKK